MYSLIVTFAYSDCGHLILYFPSPFCFVSFIYIYGTNLMMYLQLGNIDRPRSSTCPRSRCPLTFGIVRSPTRSPCSIYFSARLSVQFSTTLASRLNILCTHVLRLPKLYINITIPYTTCSPSFTGNAIQRSRTCAPISPRNSGARACPNEPLGYSGGDVEGVSGWREGCRCVSWVSVVPWLLIFFSLKSRIASLMEHMSTLWLTIHWSKYLQYFLPLDPTHLIRRAELS